MLTLDTIVRIPDHVSYSSNNGVVFLLNTQTNHYFTMDSVGGRFWELFSKCNNFREAYTDLLIEFDVEPIDLEKDLLELLEKLVEKGLVEIVKTKN